MTAMKAEMRGQATQVVTILVSEAVSVTAEA